MHRILYCFFLIIISVFISASSYAFNPETDCPSFVKVATLNDVKTALSDDKFVDGSPYLKDDKYVVCFKVENSGKSFIDIKEILEIKGRDKNLTLYGLSFVAGQVLGKQYDGLFISISGSNIILQNLTIGSAEAGAKDAIRLTGSNVSILNSQIHASQTGIAIGTAEKAADSIVIAGTRVVGNGTIDSKGVYVENGKSVSLTGTPSPPPSPTGGEGVTIDNMTYGIYVKSGNSVNISDTTFRIADVTNTIFWEGADKTAIDTGLIGKVLDASGEKVTRLAGKTPACEGSFQVYTYDPKSHVGGLFPLVYKATTSITKLSDKDKLCFKKSGATMDYSSEECVVSGDCSCLAGGDCIFDFASTGLNANHNAILVFSGASGAMLNPSIPISLSPLPDIAVIMAPSGEIPVEMPGVRDTTGDGVTVAVLGSGEDAGSRGSGVVYYEPATEEDDKETATTGQAMGADDAGGKIAAGAAKMSCGLVEDSLRQAGAPIFAIAIAGILVLLIYKKRLVYVK